MREPTNPFTQGVLMRKLLSFGALLAVASLFAVAGPDKKKTDTNPADQFGKGYSLTSIDGIAGLLVQPTDGPYAAVLGHRRGGAAVVGLSRSGKGAAPDLAFIADKDGVHIQVVDEKGVPHIFPATALLKLMEPAKPVKLANARGEELGECWTLGERFAKELEAAGHGKVTAAGFVLADKAPKTSDSPVPAAAQADSIPAGHKFLYSLARTKAITQYAKEKGVSRAAAREKVDSLDDATLHAAVQASGAFAIKAQPVGGKLTDFLEWLSTHQEQIAALVKLIMSLLAFI
jgi:hypothetical protein